LATRTCEAKWKPFGMTCGKVGVKKINKANLILVALVDILEEHYQNGPVIVTSQVESQGWLKLFEDPVIAEAITDRLIHPCEKITLNGERSYREKIKEKKTGLKKEGGLR